MRNKKRFFDFNTNTARAFAKIYHLDKQQNALMVIENVEHLNMQGKGFHSTQVIVCVCRNGHVDFVSNAKNHRLCKGGMFISLSEARISEISTSDDFSALAIVISQEFLQESVMSMMQIWPYMLYVMEHPVIELGEAEMQRVVLNYQLIIDRLAYDDHAFRREATIANLQACYLDICDFLKQRLPQHDESNTRSYAIFDEFIRTLSTSYVEHRDVQWYAEQLNLTPKYLSEVVKAVSGRTAGHWISSYVISEIKSLLKNTDLSIKEIAVEMNFPNQSFLGKYFKNVVGISPLEYRNQQ